MAARRNKKQATRNSSNSTPGWVWLLSGLVLGAALFFIVPGLVKKEGDGFFRPKPNPDAKPAPVAEDDSAAPSDAPPQASAETATDKHKETQYDFYTLLPGREVQMSDAELAASAEAEKKAQQKATQQLEAARAQAALEGRTPPPANANPDPVAVAAGPAGPRPLDESAAATVAATSPAATPAAAAVAAAVTPAATNADTRYILQAGSFGASGDAEQTKAKLAMMGLGARVESADINGKTVYRVRMGPYGTASELAEAKQKLAGSGLQAMAIKAR
ncbi:MAG: SPOR domain-containing protein [Pseudoxanthomonas sp.]